uniref:protein FAM110A n=1 Tax=Monopterus albus TaxID=43700 RepID=UPI0009B40113|nr:protein FAM110A-like [Monopterus albus]
MPVDSVQRPARTAATPARLRAKGPVGPVGPHFYRQSSKAEGRPKQSAVERLEADKAKYVKSQVALSKQQPIRPPEVQRSLRNHSTPLQPTRKSPAQTKTKQEGVQLDLEHLTNLISVVHDGLQSSTTAGSEDSKVPDCATPAHSSPCPIPAGAQRKKERLPPPVRPDRSSSAKVRLKASGPAKVESAGLPGTPAAGTVRRVDVIPQASPVKTPCRPPLFMRQPLQPTPSHFQLPLRSTASHLQLFHSRTTLHSSPLRPVVAPPKPDNTPSSPAGTPVSAKPGPTLPVLPPLSPAITRLSSSSSRKRPSLTRSKSDMSDRFSRAGTELERFFNLCGLDPADLRELTGSSSDIVSLARFQSVSAPGSECAGSGREDEDEEEDAGNAADRAPYGVSVIERNARVIKWLYGLRQAKDNANKSTNL